MLAPGIHLGISHSDYHADPSARPSLSSHIAQLVVGRSPGHAALAHPRLGGQRAKESTEGMETGSILHGMLFGGGQELIVVDEKDWRKDVAKNARKVAEAEGKIAVLAGKLDKLKAAADQTRAHLPFDLSTAQTEVTAIWESNDCPCRCRIDALLPDLWIWDLKLVEDAATSSADRNVASFGYHVQAAANIDAIETLMPEAAGRVHFGLCFVEWQNPAIGIIRKEIRGQLLDVGEHRWKRAKRIWGECLEANRWPGYDSTIVEAGCPAWVASEELENQVNGQIFPF